MVIQKINTLNRFISFSIIAIYLYRAVIDLIVWIFTNDLSIIKWKEYSIMLINLIFFLLFLCKIKRWFLILFAITVLFINALVFINYVIWVVNIQHPFYMFLHNLFLLTLMVLGPITISIEALLRIKGERKK